jgi:hypothetical protein
MTKVLSAITDGWSILIGRGEWYKDSCYEVHEVEGKYYTIIVEGMTDRWLNDESLQEIQKSEIGQYI